MKKEKEKNNEEAPVSGEGKQVNEVVSGAAAENSSDLGAIRIHNNVIAVIARLATLKVPGVVEITGSIVDGIAGMIGGKKNTDKGGVHIDIDDEAIVVDITVNLEYGVRIPHVAWQIQNDVREAVESMTGKPIKAVNVVVQSVQLSEDAGEPAESVDG